MAQRTDALITHLANLSVDDSTAWLRLAIKGEEALLPVSRGESLYIGFKRLKDRLDGTSRTVLADAALLLTRAWSRTDPRAGGEWPENEIATLISVASDYSPFTTEALALHSCLWSVVQDEERFDLLSKTIQTIILNVLEERAEVAPIEVWRRLAIRDPVRFGPTAFGALARINVEQAMAVLPHLLPTLEVLTSLRLRMRWFTSILPVTTRAAILSSLNQTLQQARPEIRRAIHAALSDVGIELGALPSRFAVVLDFLQKPAVPRDALNPLLPEDLFQ